MPELHSHSEQISDISELGKYFGASNPLSVRKELPIGKDGKKMKRPNLYLSLLIGSDLDLEDGDVIEQFRSVVNSKATRYLTISYKIVQDKSTEMKVTVLGLHPGFPCRAVSKVINTITSVGLKSLQRSGVEIAKK